MDFFRFAKEKLLPLLVSRTVFFFLAASLFTLILYAVGTAREFVDSTQLSMLKLCSVSGIFLITASVYGAAFHLEKFIRTRKALCLLKTCGYLILAVFGAVIVASAMLIITISGGNS